MMKSRQSEGKGLSRLRDARRDFPGRTGSTKLSTDHHVRLSHAGSCLPSHAFYPVAQKISSSTVLLSYDSSPSPKCQATWLWYFPHCAITPKWPDSMLAGCHEKESV